MANDICTLLYRQCHQSSSSIFIHHHPPSSSSILIDLLLLLHHLHHLVVSVVILNSRKMSLKSEQVRQPFSRTDAMFKPWRSHSTHQHQLDLVGPTGSDDDVVIIEALVDETSDAQILVSATSSLAFDALSGPEVPDFQRACQMDRKTKEGNTTRFILVMLFCTSLFLHYSYCNFILSVFS